MKRLSKSFSQNLLLVNLKRILVESRNSALEKQMSNVLWVSRMIGDLKLFCSNNNLPNSAEALNRALIAFQLDAEQCNPVKFGNVHADIEKIGKSDENHSGRKYAEKIAISTRDQYHQS